MHFFQRTYMYVLQTILPTSVERGTFRMPGTHYPDLYKLPQMLSDHLHKGFMTSPDSKEAFQVTDGPTGATLFTTLPNENTHRHTYTPGYTHSHNSGT